MSTKILTTEEFIKRAKIIHNSKYNYGFVDFKNLLSKIKITCLIHGEFNQSPEKHLSGQGCADCGGRKKITQTNFINMANKTHNNKYNYKYTIYINTDTKIKISCPEHGCFFQTPYKHINRSQGCKKCGTAKRINESLDNRKKIFIDMANTIYSNKYDYSLVEYTNNSTKTKIICPKHGVFEQAPTHHLQEKEGCKFCVKQRENPLKKTTQEFIHQAKEVHGNKYDYSIINYNTAKFKVKIICVKHGVFAQLPSKHLFGDGCPYCRESKGESKIAEILTDMNFVFERYKIFPDCKYIQTLEFDFYLSNHNLCIEFDGKQHFEPVEYFGGEIGFKKNVIRDEIKNKYCETNNIKLLRISYTENILEKLTCFCQLLKIA